MIQAWQKRLLDTKVVFVREFVEGTHNIKLPSNKYRMTLIGCGGVSTYKRRLVTAQPITLYEVFLAQGGVGGTVIVEFNVTNNPDVTIHVGDNNDRDTYITGIKDYVLRAGGGTDAIVTSTTSGTAGKMGTNTVAGDFFSEINNANIIESNTLYKNKINNIPTNFLTVKNSNYESDQSKGEANSIKTKFGYVLIEAI